jgi:uncharacterized protein (TIGR00369 family)
MAFLPPHHEVLDYLRETYLGKTVADSQSATGNWLGFTLEAIERGKATFSLIVKEDMTNPFAHIHGGMMGVVIDEVIGWAVLSLGSEYHFTTLNLNIDFLYAIAMGQKLVAEAEVIREGKRILHVESKVYNTERKLLAKATSNLIVTNMKFGFQQ